MTSLFQQLEALIPNLHGWGTIEKGICLASYTAALKVNRACEIGTWGGRTAIPIMLAMQQSGGGSLICIDPWKPEESVRGQVKDDDRHWWEVQNHEFIYQHFLHHLNKLNLGPLCEIRRMTSDQSEVPSDVSLLHVDGNHGPQALTDITRYAPSVVKYGLCVLDDLEWSGGYVKQGEKWLLENGFIMLHTLGTGAVYLRTK